MNPHRMAVESAKRMLEDTGELADMSAAELFGAAELLRSTLVMLVDAVEAQPKSVRLAAQHDGEFLNLARAARMEIHAAMGSLQRLDRFEQALTGMVESQNGGQG
ncbi:hypothetical protein ACWDHW_06125 [Streptomyces melanosporofaciens]